MLFIYIYTLSFLSFYAHSFDLVFEKNEAVKRHAFSDYLIRLKQVEIACADSREIPPGGWQGL